MSVVIMVERLESLKAGVLSGLCLLIAFVITTLLNHLVLANYFEALHILRTTLNFHWFVSAGIAAFSGLLFGVTYRYIIRTDKNPQLKAGGVFAFGLVRGLTEVDVALSCPSKVLPFVVLGLESVFWFGLAAITLDTAMQLGWLKQFSSS